MPDSHPPTPPPRPGLGPAGVNPLFLGVLIGALVSAYAGFRAAKHEILHSVLVFHLVVGGIAFVVIYGVVALLWLAWHRRLIQKIGVAGASGETPENQESVDELADERSDDIKEFMATSTDTFEKMEKRLTALEDAAPRADPG